MVSGLDVATQTARMLWWANTSQGVLYNAVKYVRVFMLIFNTGLASSNVRYKFLTMGWLTTTNAVTTSTKTTYTIGKKFIIKIGNLNPDRRCIVTFK